MEILKEKLLCDVASGVITRRVSCGHAPAGSVAGSRRPDGRICVSVDRLRFMAHRLVWFFATGEMPPHEIDHINGDPADNRIANLRLATSAQNKQNIRNARRHNSTGYLGVSWNKDREMYRADIALNGKRKFLGHYPSPQEAHSAYLLAKAALHPFQTLAPCL